MLNGFFCEVILGFMSNKELGEYYSNCKVDILLL